MAATLVSARLGPCPACVVTLCTRMMTLPLGRVHSDSAAHPQQPAAACMLVSAHTRAHAHTHTRTHAHRGRSGWLDGPDVEAHPQPWSY
jgi:hypothetical protein